MIHRRFLISLTGILLLNEVISYMVSLDPVWSVTAFIVLSAVFLAICLLSTDYGLLIVIAELVVGGKGYLYHLETPAIDISIRLSFFVIILVVWLLRRRYRKLSFFTSVAPYSAYLLTLAAVVMIGFITALVRGVEFSKIFFDVNAYLYFLLAPVVFTSLERPEQRQRIFNLFFAGILVIGIKSLVILGLFTHFGLSALAPIYRWIRDTGVGEIAHIQGNYYRVFFQSQIFGLVGFLIAFGMLMTRLRDDRHDDRGGLYVISLAGMSAILVSLSRSFWIAAASSMLVAAWLLIRHRIAWKPALRVIAIFLSLPIVSGVFVAWMLYFPLPFPLPGRGGGEVLVKERFSRQQPAVSSRNALLRPLLTHIRQHPVFGTGFATSITYYSSDPRVARGGRPARYTTSAFEWGWLDIAVKMGLLGLVIYAVFLKRLIQDTLMRLHSAQHDQRAISFGICLALVGLIVTHIFSPYLNHPLGIGMVLLSAAFLRAIPQPSV